MSLHESSTLKKIARTFSSPENADQYINKLDKVKRTPKIDNECLMSDELQKIRNEYKTLERKNKEEIENMQQQFGNNSFQKFPEFQEFLGKNPGMARNRDTSKKIQVLINKEITSSMESMDESKGETEKLDLILSSKNEEISFMKKKFLSYTETFKIQAEKLAEQEKRTRMERDELQRSLEEAQRKFDKQNCFVHELEHNNLDLKSRLDHVSKEIEKELKHLAFEAETEKKRYLANLKKLIELFQTEKARIEETISSLYSDIKNEKNQHIQDVEQLKNIIDQLNEVIDKNQKEKEELYAQNSLNRNSSEKQYKIIDEIEGHRQYTHELEMIIKNLGHDNETLETENTELKKLYEDKLEHITGDAEDNRRKLHEELETFRRKFNNLQDIKAENEYILAENEVLKTNLNNIDEKYVRRVHVLNAENTEKQRIMSFQIEEQNMMIEKLNREQSELKTIITNLEVELRDKTDEIRNLESYKSCLGTTKQELQISLDESRQIIEQTIKENDEHVTQLKNLQETEVKKLKTELARQQKECKDLQTNVIEQETLYKILKVDFDEYMLEREEQVTKFNNEKETANREYQKKIDELNSQIAELQTINLNYEEIEQDLHKQIQGLVHNINQLNYDNQQEVDKLRQEIRKQIGQELEELHKFKQELEDQIKLNEKENVRLKSELHFKTQRCNSLEEELKGLKLSHQDLSILMEDSRERYEIEIEQLKLSNERIVKRNKEEITTLVKEFEQQSLFCDHLDKRKKELERINKNYNENLEHVTKLYKRETEDLKLDLQNTKTFYQNKLSHTKTEAIFETKKYENRIHELEQELKIVKYEVDWLKDVHKE